jgi:hypothetical protein
MNHLEIIFTLIGVAFVYASCHHETMKHAKPAKRTGKRKASSKPPATVLAMPVGGSRCKPPKINTY